MQHRIDWFSYTYEISEDPVEIPGHLLYKVLAENLPHYVNGDGVMSMQKSSRRGFNASYSIGNHTYIHINTKGLVLVEHTGQGCTLLQEEGLLIDIISAERDRATRLDVATDILTDASVPMFCEMGKDNRVKASGFQHSNTGETFYYGSKKSDRTVTVYRYYPPHPRADWLRIEHRLKKNYAKQAANMIGQGVSVDDLALKANNRMNWSHHCWQPDHEVSGEIKHWRPERTMNKTIRWIHSQVIPALVKVHQEGEMPFSEVEQAFLDALREA